MDSGEAVSRRHNPIVASLCAIAMTLTLGACGGGSSTTTSPTATSAGAKAGAAAHAQSTPNAPSTSGHRTTGTVKAHLSALDVCLRAHGIVVPAQGAPSLKSASASRYRAALRACGAASSPSASGKAPRRALSPRFRDALVAFAACMRAHGVNLPAPNTTGKGPIFSAKGVDVRSVTFRTAERDCRATLTTATSAAGPKKK